MNFKEEIGKSILEAYNEQQQPSSHKGVMYTDGRSTKSGFQIHNGVSMKQNGVEPVRVDETGTTFEKNILNSGNIMREKNSMLQNENVSKEMFIPSSIVTPLPDKLPWLAVLLKMAALAEFLQQVDEVLEG